MGKIPIAEHRSSKRHIPGGVQLIIPTIPKVSVVFFHDRVVRGVGLGECSAAQEQNSGSLKAGESMEFLIIWLIVWTPRRYMGDVWGSVESAGRDVISLKVPSLVVRRELLGLGRSQSLT